MNTKTLNLKNRAWYKWLFWGWLLAVYTISSIPNINTANVSIGIPKFELRLDYIFHFVIYLILAVLFMKWKHKKISNPYKLVIVWVVGLAIAYIEELHQLIIPGRAYNPIDFIYNSIGLTLGIIISFLILRRKKEN